LAGAREGTPAQLRKRLAGDLDRIVQVALDKVPERRYGTADALTEDLRRWQNGEPVVARPIGWRERLWRRVRRHPWEMAAASLLCFAIVAVFVMQDLARVRQRQEMHTRQLATQLRQSLQITLPLLRVVAEEARLDSPELEEPLRRLRELQEKHVRELETDPGLRAEVGRIYEWLAAITEAVDPDSYGEEYLQTAKDIYEKLLQEGADDAVTANKYRLRLAEVHHKFGEVFSDQNKRTHAETHFLKSLTLRRQLWQQDPKDPAYRKDLARSHGYLGDLYLDMGDDKRAREAYQEAKKIREELFKEMKDRKEELPRVEAQFQLARTYENEGNYYRCRREGERSANVKEAIKWYDKALGEHLEVATDRPGVRKYQSDQVWVCNFLAELYLEKASWEKEPKERKAIWEDVGWFLRRAKGIQEQLSNGNPYNVSFVRDWAWTSLNLAKFYIFQQPPGLSEARKHLGHADNLLKKIKDARRTNGDFYLWALVEALRSEIDPKRQAKHDDEAVRHLEAAVGKGYSNLRCLETDLGFKGLRERNPEAFQRVLDELKRKLLRP
jgi:tetratricopeptide (TPR) repeat protein